MSSSDLGEFDTVSILLGTDDPLPLSVTVNQNLCIHTSDGCGSAPLFIYTNDLLFGGNNFNLWTAPLLVGTLTIDTAGLAEGEYSFGVSSAQETNRLGFGLSALGLGINTEPLEGAGFLNVVPEPMTLSLLGLGALALLRRRRTA